MSYTLGGPWPLVLTSGLLWLACTLSLLLRPIAFQPEAYAVPLSPLTPSLALLADVHLIGAPCMHPRSWCLAPGPACSTGTVRWPAGAGSTAAA